MMRVRTDGAVLRPAQLRALGEASTRYARDTADISDRQNIQYHWVRIEDVPAIWDLLEPVGLSTTEACGDSPRPFLGSPVAGLAADEIIDASPALAEIKRRCVGNPDFANLPRKFKTSASGHPSLDGAPEVNDVSFVGTVHPEHGPGFDLWVGGGLSTNPMLAQKLGVWIPLDEVADVWEGVASIFRDYGYRRLRNRARLKFLVADWGVERFREVLETEYLDRALVDCPSPPAPHGQRRPRRRPPTEGRPLLRRGRARRRPGQRDDALGPGRRRGEARRRAACGSRRTRSSWCSACTATTSTPWSPTSRRSACRPGRRCGGAPRWPAPASSTASWRWSTPRSVPAPWSPSSSAAFPDLDTPVTVNVNGCPNACARTQVADIGLKGQLVRTATRQVEGFQVHLGGGIGLPASTTPSAAKLRAAQGHQRTGFDDYVENRRAPLPRRARTRRAASPTWVARVPTTRCCAGDARPSPRWWPDDRRHDRPAPAARAAATPRSDAPRRSCVSWCSAVGAELELAPAEDIVEWAAATFGERFCVTSSMADAVLAHLAGRVAPGVDVVFLDTGYHFAETIGTRDAVAATLPVSVVDVSPELTVEEQERVHGPRPVRARPGPVLRAAQGPAPAAGARRLRRLGDRPPSGRDPRPGHRTRHRLGPRQGQGEGLAARPLDRRAGARRYVAATASWSIPLVADGYPSIGCQPCTRRVEAGRRPSQRPVGRSRQDRVRAPRLTRHTTQPLPAPPLSDRRHPMTAPPWWHSPMAAATHARPGPCAPWSPRSARCDPTCGSRPPSSTSPGPTSTPWSTGWRPGCRRDRRGARCCSPRPTTHGRRARGVARGHRPPRRAADPGDAGARAGAALPRRARPPAARGPDQRPGARARRAGARRGRHLRPAGHAVDPAAGPAVEPAAPPAGRAGVRLGLSAGDRRGGAALRAQGRRHIAVGSLFLAPGFLYDRAAELALEAGAVAVSAPFGADPEVARMVLARYLSARSSSSRSDGCRSDRFRPAPLTIGSAP